MLRLILILSFLTALGSLLVGQFMVKPKVDATVQELASTQTSLTTAQQEKSKAEKESREAKALAEKAVKDASEMKTTVAKLTEDEATQRARADKSAADLSVITKERNEVRDSLARWEALGVKPDGIIKLKEDLKRAQEEKLVSVEENKVLDRNLKIAKAKLTRYEGDKVEVELPAGLRGTVTSISPANDFVFLDIGTNQGLLERGKLMVRRGDKLVTKVQVVSVEANHAIANILRDWNQGDVAVQIGDAVLY